MALLKVTEEEFEKRFGSQCYEPPEEGLPDDGLTPFEKKLEAEKLETILCSVLVAEREFPIISKTGIITKTLLVQIIQGRGISEDTSALARLWAPGKETPYSLRLGEKPNEHYQHLNISAQDIRFNDRLSIVVPRSALTLLHEIEARNADKKTAHPLIDIPVLGVQKYDKHGKDYFFIHNPVV